MIKPFLVAIAAIYAFEALTAWAIGSQVAAVDCGLWGAIAAALTGR